MTTHQSGSILKDQAKGRLSGNYFGAVTICLFYYALYLILSDTFQRVTLTIENAIYQFLGMTEQHIAVSLFSNVLLLFATALISIFHVGLNLYFLNLSCKSRSASFQLFYGFTEQFGKAFPISLLQNTITLVCTLPSLYALTQFRRLGHLALRTGVILALLQLVCLAIQLYFSLSLSQCYFILLDFPQLGAGTILRQSFKIMKGHKNRLLLLEISFLPLFLLSICSFGIGYLWLLPYQKTTYSLFYLDLIQSDPRH